jgi:hypothetical protein
MIAKYVSADNAVKEELMKSVTLSSNASFVPNRGSRQIHER